MTQPARTQQQEPASAIDRGDDAAVSFAISLADQMAACGGPVLTVVRTRRNGLCIYDDFRRSVADGEIIEEIYRTDKGFLLQTIA